MAKRALALTAVLVTAAIVPPPEADATIDPPAPPAPDLDQTLASLELPSRPNDPVPPPAVAQPAPAPPPAVAQPAPAPPSAAPAPAKTKKRRNESVRSGDPLARIRACESGSNYQARSASGRYRGAYQFDRATFASVGGSGDPAAASPAEQDHRAKLLLARRGTQAWPACSTRG